MLAAQLAPSAASAQWLGAARGAQEVTAGSELETYLRVLQLAGSAPGYPWSVRGFSPREVDRLLPSDARHPWHAHLAPRAAGARRVSVAVLRPELRLVANTAFPFGLDDGAVWAGRGVTAVAQAGVLGRVGPLSVRIAPVWFRTQNRDFATLSTAGDAYGRFADPVTPAAIDVPQRFGDGPYGRWDLGQSAVSLDLPVVSAGIANSNQLWGPAVTHALVLGRNAPGFRHGYAGTSAPLNVGVGRVHIRMMLGRLEQSPYSTIPDDSSRRLASAAVLVFQPRGLDGLELGTSRFFHEIWSGDAVSLTRLSLPFRALFKSSLSARASASESASPTNQVASAFFRWRLARGAFEVYGEIAREDNSADLRDFTLEPDHTSAYTLGLQKVWRRGERLVVLRGEGVNARQTHLVRVRPQGRFYQHTPLRQGHTHLGQPLGSLGALGGDGAVVAVDRYDRDGRWTVEWNRLLRQKSVEEGAPSDRLDVQHALGLERVLLRGAVDAVLGVRGVWNLNRNFGRDAFNANVVMGARVGW